jgi:hypothetical protein
VSSSFSNVTLRAKLWLNVPSSTLHVLHQLHKTHADLWSGLWIGRWSVFLVLSVCDNLEPIFLFSAVQFTFGWVCCSPIRSASLSELWIGEIVTHGSLTATYSSYGSKWSLALRL